jgi:hydroxyquinol 1,2-dioxygenase
MNHHPTAGLSLACLFIASWEDAEMTPAELTEEVLAAYAGTPDPRLRELLAALIAHLHAFAVQTRLTPSEWLAAVEFLTATGQKCDAERQEFILLSDVLGLSSLVDIVNAAAGATESTVLGPFYVPGAPERAMGEQIGRPADGEPALIRGRVTSVSGDPLDGATLDVWQCSSNGLYDTQDPGQPPFNLRGRFVAGPDGRYEFRAVRPVSYPVPVDGPVGDLLRGAARQHWRAAHIHAIVSAPGCRSVTTHIFDASNPYLDSDAVFGVKDSLVREFRPPRAGDPADVRYVVDMDFTLAPDEDRRPVPVSS